MKHFAMIAMVLMLRVWFDGLFTGQGNGIVLGYTGTNTIVHAIVRTDDGKVHDIDVGNIVKSRWEEVSL
jgi:hypothetical protein